MKVFLKHRMDVAAFVEDQLMTLSPDWPLTMTIKPEPSVGYCVCIVTDTSLADIVERVEQTYSEKATNISIENTQNG